MRPECQRGFAIVSALFIVVALASLGAAMMYFSTTQHITGLQDLQGSRALAAARTGSDWVVANIMGSESDNAPQYACPAVSPFTFAGFTLTVGCTHSTHDEEGHRIRVYVIAATASAGGAVGSLSYVERRVDTVVATCRLSDNGLLC
ncbi:hypothetical protein AT959_12885 [Dechloromonas denitrificans]|uniref:MSHA biogenesis protein MshP n=2 Tax=Dechloromonas denitrificans TaxID=281362 RepID=A0A133XH42_9RHOO|nr:hypothetical protein AT959_12885 [Dechloromonas denitrificans]